MTTTIYRNTFIAVAPDCPVTRAEVPPSLGLRPTVATLQYQLIAAHPYELTSDEILFAVHATRTGISPDERECERERFLSKERACLRASPLGKRYGWGTHHDAEGRVALYGVGSAEYERLAQDPGLMQKLALRSSRG